jgi:Ran GTPase-activating protein (RanGAP) involved in mRNA processing and transport
MVRALVAGLQKNESLATLNLSLCAFGDDGAIALASALAHSRSLTDLQLDYCWIGDSGAETLAAALQQRESIRALNLCGNRFGAAGAMPLARLLATDHCAVETLSLSRCCIGDDGATALAESLQVNRSLTALQLKGCSIGVEGTTKLTAALRRSDHSSLRVLDLSCNRVDATGVSEHHPAAAALLHRSSSLPDQIAHAILRRPQLHQDQLSRSLTSSARRTGLCLSISRSLHDPTQSAVQIGNAFVFMLAR